jgi:tetratricopeptide (TPR) repeat protein
MSPALAVLLLLSQASGFSGDGMKALETGQYEVAAEAFRKAVAADPADYSAHFNLALAYGLLARDEDGIAEYRKTLELKPDLYEAELNCGILLLRRKDAASAAAMIEAAAAQKPGEFRPRFYLAEAEAQSGTLDRAQADYRRALELDPKSAAAESGLGRALARDGKPAEAAPHYRQAATLDPKYRNLLLELAGAFETAHQPAEAAAIYRDFAADPGAQAHLGQLLLDGKQYAEAVPVLETAYAKEPSTANAVALAMAYTFSEQSRQSSSAVPAGGGRRARQLRFAHDVRAHPTRLAAVSSRRRAIRRGRQAQAHRHRGMARVGRRALYGRRLSARAGGFRPGPPVGREHRRQLAFMRAIILDKLRQLKPALEAYEQFLAQSDGKHPDQEFQARQRARIIRHQLETHK